MRDQKADVFAVAAGRPDANGKRPRATITHMANKWLQDSEAELVRTHSTEWLP
ncbi:MAG: hypothetical protein JO122_12040 [Acetobacteraceae bacterium]|nr:hypothetical protein [Acetobacteraceae bacterium]